MSLPQKYYLNHMHAITQKRYRACWLPDFPVKLGDVGLLKDGLFTLYTTLEQEGISFEVREEPSRLAVDYSDVHSFKIDGSGGASYEMIKANITISFKSSNGLVFQAEKSVTKTMLLKDVEAKVRECFASGAWKEDWVVITEVVEMEGVTIILSSQANSMLEIKCSADLGMATNRLGDPRLGLQVVAESGKNIKLLGAGLLKPLYRASGLTKRFLKPIEFTNRGGETDFLLKEPQGSYGAFEEIEYEPLM